MLLFVGAIVGVLFGIGITYWFLQKQLEQKEQERGSELRRLREELEQAHEKRLQETIQSLQTDHAGQLQQKELELQQAHEKRLQETVQSLQTDYAGQLQRKELELQQAHEAELESRISALQAQHQAQLGEGETVSAPSGEASVQTPPLEKDRSVEPQDAPKLEEWLSQPPAEESAAETASVSEVEIATPSRNQPLEITDAIAACIQSKQLASLTLLTSHSRHPDPNIRQNVAQAIGEIIAGKPIRMEIGRGIQTLSKLSRDSSSSVRCTAVESLGKVKSDTVVPLLQNALRDSHRDVIKAASAAIARFKFYPTQKKIILPANAAKKR